MKYHTELLAAWLRWRRLRFQGSPVLFGNAVPKSGSKLLLQILGGIQRIGPFAPVQPRPVRMIMIDGRVRELAEVLEDLRGLSEGDIGWGYVHSTPETVDLLTQEGWIPFFLIRDPRDVLVSHVHYATEIYAGHSMRPVYEQLPDFNSRLRLAIRGTEDYPYLPSARGRYEPFLGFLDAPEIRLLRFEDLRTDLRGSVARMLSHIESTSDLRFNDGTLALDTVLKAVAPAQSPTFRRGAVGDWKEAFTAEHEELFKEVTGDLLVRLGYEDDEDW